MYGISAKYQDISHGTHDVPNNAILTCMNICNIPYKDLMETEGTTTLNQCYNKCLYEYSYTDRLLHAHDPFFKTKEEIRNMSNV